ncbi:hypothetical protein SADUNF_Sadunf15G0019000 [Salix dunnii]|uniref:Uncharacterized protein n=1 Tax=Salix dunnii TaxID=1413687 RepID=A0A835MKP3_9ROSI|nr:hypothetical protein SADUNF_Sadunf15G0019000 [Salix dunnii]
MDGYNLDPLAQDSATGGHSFAVKGGVGGGVLFLLLAVIIYVFIKSRKCSMKCELQVDGASSSSGMDDHSKLPLAPDSAAAKVGGVAGVILVLILVIIYVIIRRGGCSMTCDVNVNEAPRREAEEA